MIWHLGTSRIEQQCLFQSLSRSWIRGSSPARCDSQYTVVLWFTCDWSNAPLFKFVGSAARALVHVSATQAPTRRGAHLSGPSRGSPTKKHGARVLSAKNAVRAEKPPLQVSPLRCAESTQRSKLAHSQRSKLAHSSAPRGKGCASTQQLVWSLEHAGERSVGPRK